MSCVLVSNDSPRNEGEVSHDFILSQGAHTISLSVEDRFGHVTQAEQSITVLPANQAPLCSITTPEDGAVYRQGQGVDFLASASDDQTDTDRLTYIWTSSLEQDILDEGYPTEEGVIQFARSNFAIGTHEITLNVSDDRGSICTDTREIIVATVPIIDEIQPMDQVINENKSVNFQITVRDEEDDSDALLVYIEQLDGTLIHSAIPVQGVVSYTEPDIPVGEFEYQVRVVDSVGLETSSTQSFIINGLPSAPHVGIVPSVPQTAHDIRGMAIGSADPEGEEVQYRFEWYLENVLWSVDNVLSSEYTQSGQEWLLVAIPYDEYGDGKSQAYSFRIENTAPEHMHIHIEPHGDKYNDSVLHCHGEAEDIDDDPLVYTYEWSVHHHEILGTEEDLDLAGKVHPDEHITCTATATDPYGLQTTGSKTIHIENRAPVLFNAFISHEESYNDDTIHCNVQASDPDGDHVDLRYTWLLNNESVLGHGKTINLSDHRPIPGSKIHCLMSVYDEHEARKQKVLSTQILNRDPVITGITMTDPVYNTEQITCMPVAVDADQEELTYTYVWENSTTGIQLGSQETLVLDTTIASVGDEIVCMATIEDGLGVSITSSVSGTVQNRAPIQPIVTLTPFPAVEGDSLSCSYTTPEDEDGDSVSVALQWLVDETVVQDEGSALTAVSPIDDQEVVCSLVLVDDHGAQTLATDTLIVGYIPPSVESITLNDPAYTHIDMVADVVLYSEDLVHDMSYRWYVDGVEISGQNQTILNSDYYSRGQTVEIEAYLGTMTVPVYSESVVISNAPPTIPAAIISTDAPLSGVDDLLCLAAGGRDPDLDDIHYGFQWFKNGTEWEGCPQNTSTVSRLPASYIEGGDEWKCSVIAFDGQDESVGYSVSAISPDSCHTTECDFGIALSTEQGIDFLKIDVSEGDPLGRYSLSQDFYMMTTEITAEEYSAITGYNPSFFSSSVDLPVGNINWHETVAFANTITNLYNSKKGTSLDTCYSCTGTGDDVECTVKSDFEGVAIYSCSGFRLPTEAEWELAARSGTTEDIWTGHGPNLGGTIVGNECSADIPITDGTGQSFLEQYAWFCGNDEPHGTKSVAGKSPNGFGMYDMSGNVWEWSHDVFGDVYPSTTVDPIGPTTGNIFVLKGGRWGNVPSVLKLGLRTSGTDTYRDRCVGARLVRSYISTFSDVDLIDLCTTDEDCENGYDEDYDGLVDCEDPSCSSDTVCTGFSGEVDCSDGVDDEGDGLTDCGDPECFEETQCLAGSGKVTPSTQVCSLFDGCLATSYELEGATNCMDFIYGYDAGDDTYAPWMECILDIMVDQVGTCSADELGGCDCVAVEACDVAYDTPPVESTENEVIDCTLPQYASTSDCINTTIDCTDSNDWCDPSCLTECNDPVLLTDPQNCSLCEDVVEDTSAPDFEAVDCTNASDPDDDNYCHTECLVAEGYDCEDDPHSERCEECFPGGGHHSEDGLVDCDDASNQNSVGCEASYEETCMAYCHYITKNQDPDYYSESLCYFDSCEAIVLAEEAEGDPWYDCMITFPDPQDAISTEACVSAHDPPFIP